MSAKTKVIAQDECQDLLIVREFDLPLSLLYKAFTEAELVEQWMGTKVLKLENRQHGGWRFVTSNADGKVVFRAHGTIHEMVFERKIVRTFEMDTAPFPAQLEFLEFESPTADTSRLKMQIIFRSVADRNQLLQLPFVHGLNRAHDRLQELLNPNL